MLESFIARQPILNSNGEIYGYELLFRSSGETENASFDSEMEAGATILNNMLSNFGQDWLLAGKNVFINVAEMTLFSDFVSLLDPKKTIFEITPMTVVTDSLIERVHQLKEDGFTFAFDDCALDPNKSALLPYCDVAKIDCQRTGMVGLNNEILNIKKISNSKNLNIIATKIESDNEFKSSQIAGANFFQGFYFEKPQTLKTKNLTPNAAALLQILNLTRKEADCKLIEDALKKDVATSLKLLRYINSAGFGLRCEITSFKHAVQLLGYQKLTKWILLLLATSNKNAPPALAKSAICRGKFMEIIGEHLFGKDDADNLFITGTFSLLDALLGVEMETVIPSLGLPDNINDALLEMTGPYFPFLMLAIATERGNSENIIEKASELGITADIANKALIDAVNWTESFSF